MQRIRSPQGPYDATLAGTMLVLGPRMALTVFDGTHANGVATFGRTTPAHCVLVGNAEVTHSRGRYTGATIALPPNTPHAVVASERPVGVVAYLDARRYRFEDAERLAAAWRGFMPGRDDPREAFGDALKRPRRQLDARLDAMLELIEQERISISEAARRVGLSESRATHLMTEKLGAPPRSWRPWLRLRNAIGEVIFGNTSLTQAAHRAGFTDSAHLTRTSRAMFGVPPSLVVPPTVFVTLET